MDLDKAGPDGKLLIPDNAHARISAPEKNGGAAMLRRPFSYHDGISDDGTPDAGLLFVCWQADPFKGFIPVQRKLDRGDALSPFIRHEASGLFAVPGGAASGGVRGAAAAGGVRPRGLTPVHRGRAHGPVHPPARGARRRPAAH